MGWGQEKIWENFVLWIKKETVQSQYLMDTGDAQRLYFTDTIKKILQRLKVEDLSEVWSKSNPVHLLERTKE